MKKIVLLFLLLGPLAQGIAETEAELFATGENHFRAGNYLLALDAYSELLAEYPLSDRIPADIGRDDRRC